MPDAPTPSDRPADDPTADAPLDATRALAPDAGGTVGQTPVEAAASAAESGGLLVPGYEVFGEIGQGGMGAVFRARQLALGRDVAIKVLKGRYTADSPAVRRFLDEAHVTGQLQHPGIPPVHHVGTLPDGRPYLVMKLIRGDTLADLLDRAPVDRGRLIAAFAQVCQAVAYAHSRRVIHRDLKPQNVMVGAFGEVQVMDWGLAKVLPVAAAAPRADGAASGVVPLSEMRVPRSDQTLAGSVLGTPAFMAPEQAGGEVEKVDERADVFGLGAVLCTVLTGGPPYTGADVNELHLKAIRGETADCRTRLDASGADPALVALCKQCLAVKREDRPRDAGAVADAVAGLLAAAEERARQAELDRVRAEGELALVRFRESERQFRRRFQRALGTTIVVLFFAGVGIAKWGRIVAWIAKLGSGNGTKVDVSPLIVQRDEHRKALIEREIPAALAETYALCDRGNQKVENPTQWRLALAAARVVHGRATVALISAVDLEGIGQFRTTDDLRKAVNAASARIKKDESDCETAELYERWLLDVLLHATTPWREKALNAIHQSTDRLFARLEIDLATAPPDAVVTAVTESRLRTQLATLLLLDHHLSNRQRHRPTVERVMAAVAAPDGLERATTDGELIAYLRGAGQKLTSAELAHFAAVRALARDGAGRHVRALCDEAILRNPANLLALALRSGRNARFAFAGDQQNALVFVTLPGATHRPDPALVPRSRAEDSARGLLLVSNALARRSDLGQLWGWAGAVAAEDGLFDLAADWYKQAVARSPERVEFRVGLADALMGSGRATAALTEYRAAFAGPSGADLPPAALTNAARCAACLATSHDEGSGLNLEQKRELRLAAMGWVRRWMRAAPRDGLEVFVLRHDPAFRGVRDPLALDALPPDEAARWVALWDDLQSLKTTGDQKYSVARPLPRTDAPSGPQLAPPPREVTIP